MRPILLPPNTSKSWLISGSSKPPAPPERRNSTITAATPTAPSVAEIRAAGGTAGSSDYASSIASSSEFGRDQFSVRFIWMVCYCYSITPWQLLHFVKHCKQALLDFFELFENLLGKILNINRGKERLFKMIRFKKFKIITGKHDTSLLEGISEPLLSKYSLIAIPNLWSFCPTFMNVI